MQCDMCGRETSLVKAKVEGTILDVCKNCARFGEIVRVQKPIQLKKTPIRKLQTKERILVVVPDYYKLIKQARSKLGLKQEEVADKISEKHSLYHKIENGQMKPSLSLARKLEKFFSIKLVEEFEDNPKLSSKSNSGTLTIGDLIRKQ
jgi:putative transcription factor